MPETLEHDLIQTLPEDYWDGELVPRNDPRAAFISVNPERLGGTPCFVGTRVPIKNLWDYVEASGALEEFLDDFEGVPREEVMAALRLSYQRLLDGLLVVKPMALQESRLSADQLQRLSAAGTISVSPNVVSGSVVFAGTRVPIYNLWDYLNGGDSIDDFLESFPTVRREQVHQALKLTQAGTAHEAIGT